eukprot:scaffold4839_cov136-Isochrysis_galbana.AAC.5
MAIQLIYDTAQAENATKSKVARNTAATLAKTHGVSTLHALLSANKAGTCPRFAAGLCPNNKKGDSCTADHKLEGAWVDNPDGKRACTIACKLPPHSKIPGVCRNGKSCAYLHNKYAAHAPFTKHPDP